MSRLTRRRNDEPDAGISIVELLTASVISLMVLALVGTVFIQVTRLTADSRTTKDSTANAWIAMDEITRVVRQGAQVQTGLGSTEGAVLAGSTASALTIDSNVDASVVPGQYNVAPTRVAFSVSNAGDLVETRLVATPSTKYWAFTGTPTRRTFTGPIDTSTTSLFVYWTGSAASPTQIVPGASGLTAAEAISVNAVTVNLTMTNRLTTTTDPVRLTNMVTMPNIAILNGGN